MRLTNRWSTKAFYKQKGCGSQPSLIGTDLQTASNPSMDTDPAESHPGFQISQISLYQLLCQGPMHVIKRHKSMSAFASSSQQALAQSLLHETAGHRIDHCKLHIIQQPMVLSHSICSRHHGQWPTLLYCDRALPHKHAMYQTTDTYIFVHTSAQITDERHIAQGPWSPSSLRHCMPLKLASCCKSGTWCCQHEITLLQLSCSSNHQHSRHVQVCCTSIR